ncbi:ATP-binding protein [Streptomyces sp. NPDC048723]|uniref:ATP-binding protein n=1 Tax=Streptomyces sp. NPDC048723 TaxID=3365589 RepID=UPI00371AEA5F
MPRKTSAPPQRFVVVSGDGIADWVIARKAEVGRRRGTGNKWQTHEAEISAGELPGGARLLAELVEAVKPANFNVRTHRWPNSREVEKPKSLKRLEKDEQSGNAEPFGDAAKISHYYTTLGLFPLDTEADQGKEEDKPPLGRWRVAENLGITKQSSTKPLNFDGEVKEAELVLIVDSGLGYCNHPGNWLSAIGKKRPPGADAPPWILLKLGGEKFIQIGSNSPLWEALKNHKDRLIVVTAADDLRRNAGVEISQGVSWERAAGDCTTALRRMPLLIQCRYVIVSFGPVGALLFDRDGEDKGGGRVRNYLLLFDPARLERSPDFWGHGQMWGYTSTLMAALASVLMKQSQIEPDAARIESGVRIGLRAMRRLYECGFGKEQLRPPKALDPSADTGPPANAATAVTASGPQQKVERFRPAFPVSEVASVIKDEGKSKDPKGWARGKLPATLAKAEVDPTEPFSSWSILANNHERRLHQLARDIVLKGPAIALADVPRGEYGDLVTVDRDEIESFQSVRALVRDYAEKGGTRALPQSRQQIPEPLSIAVFGAPGSGKSTAVREVIYSLKIPDIRFELKEFNLSQFRDTSDMEDSLHLVRDDGLRGGIPLVLWDEFDTYFESKLGWLRYFLSPMQDGTFQQGQAVHPIGRSIFVFAGGVSSSLSTFQNQEGFAEAKGPDFVSRVRGAMELKGIDKTAGDELYIIRRAVLLRSILEKETQLFRNPVAGHDVIDPGVLNALLEVDSYRHGVRSMKAIVATSSLSGEYYFGRSNLPAETQLNLHVVARTFYDEMRDSTSVNVPLGTLLEAGPRGNGKVRS